MSPIDTISVPNAPTRTKKRELKGGALERVRYYQRQLITAEDMIAEQNYFRQKLRRHNRFLHGWGAVCGLAVRPAPIEGEPWRVSISSGYALSPQGDEIYVPETVCLDLAKCGLENIADACEPGRTTTRVRRGGKLYVAIRYVECPTRPVRVHPAGCSCDGTDCEFSRIRDDYEIGCLLELPDTHRQRVPEICDLRQRHLLAPCPDCPDDPWVVLAEVSYPDTMTTELAEADIDNFIRRQLYSTALLQEQLIDCCCERQEPPPPPPPTPVRVIRVTPADNQVFTNTSPENVVLGFNKNLIPASANPGTITVHSSAGVNIPGSVSYNQAARTATFTPQAAFTQFLTGGVTDFIVTARGSGANPITDVDNLALDGDANSTAGGNFQSTFRIQILIG